MLDFPSTPTANQIFSSGTLSWRWDGVKWLVPQTAPLTDTVNVLAPASGTTVTLIDFRPVLINTAALAALAVMLPPLANYSTLIEISFSNPISSLSVQSDTGTAVPNGPTSAYGPGAALQFRYTPTGWVYWK